MSFEPNSGTSRLALRRLAVVPLPVFQESELANRPAEVDFDQLAGFDVLLGGKARNSGGALSRQNHLQETILADR